MLYSCSPVGAMAGSGITPTGKSKRFAVDLHCHVVTPAAEEIVAEAATTDPADLFTFINESTREVNRRMMEAVRDKLVSVEARLVDMDTMGIDIQAISPSPTQFHYSADAGVGQVVAQTINNRIAEITHSHPDRFVGLGTVPMQAPDLAVTELERMVNDLGLRGVEIGTNVAGEELSDQKFHKFFAKAEALDLLIFMHPHGFTEGQRLSDHYLINIIGNPLDSTVALSHLIFGGVLEKYQNLKICVAHGGGFLPAYSGRLDHAHLAREDCRRCIAKPPSSYLKKLYFDTVVFAHDQLEYLIRKYGSDHIVLGTDYPFDMGVTDPVGFVESAGGLTDAEKSSVVGENAMRLLKIQTKVDAAR